MYFQTIYWALWVVLVLLNIKNISVAQQKSLGSIYWKWLVQAISYEPV